MDRVFSFLLWPKREARGPWKQGRKKQGPITCRTDRENEANKMFIIWLCWLFRFWKGDQELEVRTATYGPGIDQSQHAKSVSHIIREHIAGTQTENRLREAQLWVLWGRPLERTSIWATGAYIPGVLHKGPRIFTFINGLPHSKRVKQYFKVFFFTQTVNIYWCF